MCKCNPLSRTPFCGRPGCEWPNQDQTTRFHGEIRKFQDNPFYGIKSIEYRKGFEDAFQLASEFIAGIPDNKKQSGAKQEEPHKIMTIEEYENMDIIDWHMVCKNWDGMGSVAIKYIST